MKWLLVLLLFASNAYAVVLQPEQCQSLALFMGKVAEVRDFKADQKLHTESLVRANEELPLDLQAMLAREIAKVYDMNLPPELVIQEVYGRCMRSKGDMGIGS